MLSQEQLETLELPDYSVFVEDVQVCNLNGICFQWVLDESLQEGFKS